jgi:hypothetical protein
MSKLPVLPNMAHSINNARKFQGLANFNEWKTNAQSRIPGKNSLDMIDGSNPQPDQESQDDVKFGGVCMRKRGRNTENGKLT